MLRTEERVPRGAAETRPFLNEKLRKTTVLLKYGCPFDPTGEMLRRRRSLLLLREPEDVAAGSMIGKARGGPVWA
jgi:hypothetical protein